jgi:hypothetical protein
LKKGKGSDGGGSMGRAVKRLISHPIVCTSQKDRGMVYEKVQMIRNEK